MVDKTVSIESKIVAAELVKPGGHRSTEETTPDPLESTTTHKASIKLLKRAEVLPGKTYKIRPPTSEHAFYVTINVAVSPDTGKTIPAEIFVNTKDMSQFQWIVACTRIMSALFRHQQDVKFLVDELIQVHDPKGGYFCSKRERFIPSVVAEIGYCLMDVLEGHKDVESAEPFFVRSELDVYDSVVAESQKDFCEKCGSAKIKMESGCKTCSDCGYSECG